MAAATRPLALSGLGQISDILAAAGHGDSATLDLYTALLTGLASQQISNDPGGDRWSRLVEDAVDRLLPPDDAAGPPTTADVDQPRKHRPTRGKQHG